MLARSATSNSPQNPETLPMHLCTADPLPVVTLDSAGPVITLSVSPADSGLVFIFTSPLDFSPLSAPGRRLRNTEAPLNVLPLTDNGDGSFTVDLSASVIAPDDGQQILVALSNDDGSEFVFFTPAGAALVEVDPSPLAGNFPGGTLAAFAFVGALPPCPCRRQPLLSAVHMCTGTTPF